MAVAVVHAVAATGAAAPDTRRAEASAKAKEAPGVAAKLKRARPKAVGIALARVAAAVAPATGGAHADFAGARLRTRLWIGLPFEWRVECGFFVSTGLSTLHLAPMHRRLARISTLLLLSLVLSAPALRAQREKIPAEDLEIVEKTWPLAKKTNTGIRYVIMEEGSGARPKPGESVAVLYTGKLLSGAVFDETQDKDKPFRVRVARDQVIQGWDQVLQLMRVGEKRLVIIPPELGYGTRGQAPRIPRNATLVFIIELLEITPN